MYQRQEIVFLDSRNKTRRYKRFIIGNDYFRQSLDIAHFDSKLTSINTI
jgi:hypothetical protein